MEARSKLFVQKVFCVLLLCTLLLSGCRKADVLHNLGELEVNRLLRVLQEKGLAVEKVKQGEGTWLLQASKKDEAKVLRELQRLRLLQVSRVELPPKPSLSASRDEQRFHYERSLSLVLEETLRALDGVLDARVHLHLPPRDPVFGRVLEENFRPSASVLLIQDRRFRPTPGELAMLVAAAAGMRPENVAVLLQRAGGRNSGRKGEI